ncbi:MAG: hypothetical protein HY707_12270, partial [Ignavibacteriae bacterium]|nr:hypothetical protein [Ignavibacteriota bacterium]
MGKILILLILTTTAIAQERLLVNPNNEVIPLQKGESAFEVAKKYVLKRSSSSECPDKITFAYRPKDLPNTNFGAMHGDVLGMWFIAPASGTIDTLFWMAFAVGAPDSLIYIRIFKSIIYPGRGPGYPPYPAPCIPWGYYVNTNDLDQGVAPFRDEATDTHWVSTLPGITTFYPLGDELWGNGGFPVIDHANSINALPLNVLGYQPTVKEGDPFFITMRVPMCAVCLDDRTEWAATGFRVSPHDELYPSRLWKFYEHDRGPSNCSNFPIDSMKRGWVARGGFGVDTLDVAVYNWWYVMSVTSNTSPTFISIDNLTHTLSTNQREVQAEIEDCNATNPESAGVASATLYYTINGVTKDSGGISMTNIGGNLWSGFIPATSAGSIITYFIQAQDLYGESTTSGVFSYQVVTLR